MGGRNKIPGCIKKIQQYNKIKSCLFHLYFPDKLLHEIKIWKKTKRDKLIHDLENNYELISDTERLKDTANKGDELMRELNSAVMRWKRQAQKNNLIP